MNEVSNTVENRRRDLIESVRVRRDEKRKVLKDQIEAITDEKKKLAKIKVMSCKKDVKCSESFVGTGIVPAGCAVNGSSAEDHGHWMGTSADTTTGERLFEAEHEF
ncbi:hypothetical protein OSTOST_07428 [Ostertagia ostertagi]